MLIINGISDRSEEDGFIIDPGFYFGKGVFETILVREKVHFLHEHVQRINNSATILGIKNKVDINAVEKLVKEYDIKHCVMKIILTDENFIISTRKNNYTDKDYQTGFKLKISKLKRNPESISVYHKTLNYLDNLLEREKALEQGFQEVLFLNSREKIAECSVSNIFIIKDKKLYTPSLSCGILDGILRQWINKNFLCEEVENGIDFIKNADEIFLTNSIMGIMKVSEIEAMGTFGNHAFTNEISEKYRDYLQNDK